MRWTMAIPSVWGWGGHPERDSVVIVLPQNPCSLTAPAPPACWQNALFPAPFLTAPEAGWPLALHPRPQPPDLPLPLTPSSPHILSLVGMGTTEAQWVPSPSSRLTGTPGGCRASSGRAAQALQPLASWTSPGWPFTGRC